MFSSTVKAWVLGPTIALAVVGLPQRVSASSHNSGSANTQRARRHFLAGKRAFEAKRYAAALKEFEAGYAIDPRPGFLLNMGHAARRLGELKRARDYYLKFLESDPPATDRRATIALVVEIDRQLASAAATGSHASVVPEPAAVTSPPAASPLPVETVAVATLAEVEPAAAAPLEVAVAAETPRRVLLIEPAVAVRVTSRVSSAPLPVLTLGDAPAATLVAQPSAREELARPIYHRWWFWAGTGVAAGAATAILLGAFGSASSPRDSGTWGQIKL
jgi:tetratricopeptide (TPR) repeat protein